CRTRGPCWARGRIIHLLTRPQKWGQGRPHTSASSKSLFGNHPRQGYVYGPAGPAGLATELYTEIEVKSVAMLQLIEIQSRTQVVSSSFWQLGRSCFCV